jgi:4-hydroxy-tetrahydrodipicolinate reductase
MVKLIVTGVGGKMGLAILRSALADGDCAVVGATEAPGHPLAGKSLRDVGGSAAPDLIIGAGLGESIGACDVVIDFTAPLSSLSHIETATAAGKAIVVGTTGLTAPMTAEIRAKKAARIVLSPNMSVGVNVMFDAVARLSRRLGPDYDVEIVEMHHRWKKDAPSGTALRLKEAVESGQEERRWIDVFGRNGMTGERQSDEIAVFSLRGGDVVGDHTVIFAGIGDRLEITHKASTRDNFARGAVLAAKWLAGREPGFYTMKDVLGL